MGVKELNEGLDELEATASAGDGLTRSLSVVADTNPDEEARREMLSRRTGVPAAWVPEFKDEVSRRSLLESPAVKALPEASPKTTQWLSRPDNARVAHDDIETLAGIEGVLDMMGRGAPAIGRLDVVGAFASGQKQQFQGRIGWRLKEGDTTPGLKEEADVLGGEIAAQNRVMKEKGGSLSGDFLEPAAQVLGQMFESGKYAVGKGLKTGLIMGAVGTAMGPAAPVTGPAAALAGLGAGTTAGFFEDTMRVEGGQAYLELTGIRGEKGEALPEESVRTASTIVGIVNGALELAGLKVLASPWKRLFRKGVQEAASEEAKKLLAKQTTGRAALTFAREYAAGVSAETVQEIAQEVTNVLAEETLKSQQGDGTFDPASAEEIGRRLYDIASQTARAMAVIGIVGPGANLRSDLRSARAARDAQDAFTALGEASATSKLRTRLPDKFREFVEHATKDGPVANVFIPAEEWNTYWQEAGADPAAVAEEVLGDREQYQEAVATGSDLVIPTGKFAEVLAGTEHYAGLSRDLRLHSGDMTAREAELFRQNFPGRVAELDALADSGDPPQGSDRKVYEDVLTQLTAAGHAPDVAAREAAAWQVHYRTRAQRRNLGEDPYDLYQQRKVRITAPGLDGVPEGVPAGATFSQAVTPPEGYPAKQEGFEYDGTYEGTGVHQYTDRNPDSTTYRDTIAVKAPEQLAGKIEGIRKRRELGQAGRAGEPVAVLTGEELDPYLEKGDRVAAVRAYYKEHLQGKPTAHPKVGTIEFKDEGFAKLRQGKFVDDLRFAAIPAIRPILERGDYLGRKENTKSGKRKYIAFHYFAGDVSVGGEIHRFYVTVGEDTKGKLFYNLSRSVKEERLGPVSKDRGPEPRGGGDATYDQSVLPPDDGVNLVLLPQEGDTTRRGFIRFGPAGETEIGLLEKANLSTFLHETGHAWLEELRADAALEGASEQLASDWKTIAEYLGIPDLAPGTAIPQGSHETFARSFEAYLMEGKAPSPELVSAFARFKAWLVQVYREVSRLGVSLTPEVRGVLDRLVATDEEIAAAEGKLHRAPLFTSAEAAGMTDAEFAVYRSDHEVEAAEARDTLGREMISEFNRETTALWKEDWERVEGLVEQEANRDPVFQVYHLLTRGELLDGSTPAEPIRLSRKAFVEAYGQEFVDRLPPKWFKKMTAKEGMHPDLVAEMFGFVNGSEMIRRLQEAPTRQEWIRQETDRRMKEIHGDMLNDGSISQGAIDAVHNDRTGRRLREELRAIGRKHRAAREEAARGGKPTGAQQAGALQRSLRLAMEASIPPVAAFRAAAAKTIRNKSVMSLRPDLYLRAEEKAGKKAFEAASKDNWEKAGQEKKKQLLNHYLYLESRKAQGEVDVTYRYVKSLLASTGQERIGKAGGDYLEQINALLEQYEFRTVTNKAIEERRSLVEWAQAQEEAGLEPDIPPVILYNARAVNYRELKLHQLESLKDALRNIEHLARLQGHLMGEQAAVSFAEAVTDLVGALHDNVGPGKRIPIDKETRSAIEKSGVELSILDVVLLKAEQLIEWADGKDITGAWNRFIFQPIADAQAAEGDLTVKITAKLQENVLAYAREIGGTGEMRRQTGIEILNEQMTRQAIVAAALNTGNQSNLDKLLGGRSWSEDHLEGALSQMTAADWRFVQQTWDLIESMWPDIAALHKRMTGVELKKIEPRKFTVTTKDGATLEVRGGYYPVVYDSEVSSAGAKQLDAKSVEENFKWYVRPATEKGHTRERTQYQGPILLSLEVIPQHFASVIHDLTHREAIVNAWRLLKNDAVKQTVTETMGAPYHRMLNLWLASVATDRDAAPTGTEGLNKWMDRLRMNATIVAMGFKFTTVIAQAMDIVQSFRRVKGRHLSRAIVSFYKNPAETRRFVHAKSGEMRHREGNLDRDLRDLGRTLRGKTGMLPAVQRAAMRGIAVVDMAASIPTWMGAYNQALSDGLSETDAIRWADRAVRLSNPAGGAKDLSAIQRDRNFKLFTMFYSYFNVMYNAGRDVVRTTTRWAKGQETVSARDPRAQESFSGGELAITALALWIVPSLAGELLAGRGKDDDEEWWEWTLRTLAVYPFLSLPMMRDVANAVESGREYRMTPVAGAFSTLAKEAVRLKEVGMDDRDPADLILPTIDLIGYFVGLPTGQAKITGRYTWDLMQGETPESAPEFMRNMMFYRKRQ